MASLPPPNSNSNSTSTSTPALETPDDHSNNCQHGFAPWYAVPPQPVISVEHPCIIKNVEKGIKSLGGELKLSQVLSSTHGVKILDASLRPDDPFAKHLLSSSVKTANIAFKVTVPKRTGRKRKRGSSGPFLTEEEIHQGRATTEEEQRSRAVHGEAAPSSPRSQYVEASTVFQTLVDNASNYTVTPVGVIEEAHRFRSLPDIQYSGSQNRVMHGIREYLMPMKYETLKQYDLDTSSSLGYSPDVGPATQFLQTPAPHTYLFRQNPLIKYTVDEQGKSTAIHTGMRPKFNAAYLIDPADGIAPTSKHPQLPPEENLQPAIQELIPQVKAQLEERPVITRHVLYNKLGWAKREFIRSAMMYCGYYFDSGPFRDALVKFGFDPRLDSACRRYQTISYITFRPSGQLARTQNYYERLRSLKRADPATFTKSHIFDGLTVPETGNLFQICDITDPDLRHILDVEDIRTTCALTYQGWYHSGTWAKALVIFKDKVNSIHTGRAPDSSCYQRILTWPEEFSSEEMYLKYKEEINLKHKTEELAKEHALMYLVRAANNNPRWVEERVEAFIEKSKGMKAVGTDEVGDSQVYISDGSINSEDQNDELEHSSMDDEEFFEDDIGAVGEDEDPDATDADSENET